MELGMEHCVNCPFKTKLKEIYHCFSDLPPGQRLPDGLLRDGRWFNCLFPAIAHLRQREKRCCCGRRWIIRIHIIVVSARYDIWRRSGTQSVVLPAVNLHWKQ